MTTNTQQALALNTYVRLVRCTNAVTEKMHKHLSDHKLTISQFGVLETLHSLGPLCQKDLGVKILKTGGNITMVVDNLEKRKLVERVRDERDRRKFSIRLTPEGYAVIDRILPVHADIAEQVFSGLSSEEQEDLGRLLERLGKFAAQVTLKYEPSS